MSTITGVKQIALVVDDVNQASHFYGQVLGLSTLYTFPGLAFLACGTIRIMLRARGQDEEVQNSLLYFSCEDIHAAYEELRNRGLAFVQPPHVVGRTQNMETWAAFFEDPSGNMLALMSDFEMPSESEE